MLIQAIDSYLELRRAAGFQMKADEGLLRDFARFAADRGELQVRCQTAIQWAANAPSALQRERRLGTVRRFADHARAEDSEHDLVPRQIFAGKRSRRLPVLFSSEQLGQLLDATSRLRPKGSLRPLTYHTLFGLLACTGLRISEAMALLLDDVTADGLVVRRTKFRKTRLVPLHQTTTAAIGRYLKRRRFVGGLDDHLFVSTKGRGLTYAMVNGTFRYLVRSIDVRLKPGQRQPRIHDLRHRFAVRALESCTGGGDQVARHILALSTYLGHTHVTDTYWYLHATPHLMKGISDACEALLVGEKR